LKGDCYVLPQTTSQTNTSSRLLYINEPLQCVGQPAFQNMFYHKYSLSALITSFPTHYRTSRPANITCIDQARGWRTETSQAVPAGGSLACKSHPCDCRASDVGNYTSKCQPPNQRWNPSCFD